MQRIITGAVVGLTTAMGALALVAPAGAAPQILRGACDASTPDGADTCVVTFPAHTMKPLDSEQLYQYTCPNTHPYLESKPDSLGRGIGYEGIGTTAIVGVLNATKRPDSEALIAIGIGNGIVTNWITDPRDYQVALHCTSNPERGYTP